MTLFQYDSAVATKFPAVVGGVLRARGVANGPTPPGLEAAYRAEQEAVLARLGDAPLSEVPSLAAWRRAFRAFGVDPTAYRSAAEALLRRLTKQGSIPSISTLVDLGNLVAIRYAMPVAVFDLASISGALTVRPADGSESFTDLGSGERESPLPGEIIFIDEAGHVAARRWCWRQSAESATGPTTTDVLITVEGHHAGAYADAGKAINDLVELLAAAASPTLEVSAGVVSAGEREFPVPGGR